MDFSNTHDAAAYSEQFARVLLLQEVLARIELPPLDDVPGDDDVTDGRLADWTIPGTRLRIARLTTGCMP